MRPQLPPPEAANFCARLPRGRLMSAPGAVGADRVGQTRGCRVTSRRSAAQKITGRPGCCQPRPLFATWPRPCQPGSPLAAASRGHNTHGGVCWPVRVYHAVLRTRVPVNSSPVPPRRYTPRYSVGLTVQGHGNARTPRASIPVGRAAVVRARVRHATKSCVVQRRRRHAP